VVEDPGTVPLGLTPDGCCPSWIYTVYDAITLDMDYFDSWIALRLHSSELLVGLNDLIFATLTIISVKLNALQSHIPAFVPLWSASYRFPILIPTNDDGASK